MSKIDDVKTELQTKNYFFHDSSTNYVRVLDTPHVWGMPFGRQILPQAIIRQAEFERAIVEIIQKTRYRCDVASLNCPDPDWTKAILGAMDTALSNNMDRSQRTQFRFLFGQTPMCPVGEPWNLIDFKAALIRLVRTRSYAWERVPEIWVGRFYELEAGLSAQLFSLFTPSMMSDFGTKMTWNHSKIIAMDGCEALVGGHNLNMDLFRSYPPVHDVSIVVHGSAAHGSQLYLNQMWQVDSDILTKESLDPILLIWENRDSEQDVPADPLSQSNGQSYVTNCQNMLVAMHDSGVQLGVDPFDPVIPPMPFWNIRANDLRTLDDLKLDVIKERVIYNTYDKFDEYKKATRMLSVGKYWVGLKKNSHFLSGSELMKKNLIMNATSSIRMSQMDLISAWKNHWSAHVVCHWIIASLLLNKYLKVEIVVSPLDAGAGAGGDQYSFGSGARRTFELMEYYMMHDVDTDAPLRDPTGERKHALERLFVAPLFYTDQVPANKLVEGDTYKWPDLTKNGYTSTLKQPPLSEQPPVAGIIGYPAKAAADASGYSRRAQVESAPGNHAKIMIIDDELYVVGSDNLYPGNLSEFNYLVEGVDAVNELINSYWKPLWQYSSPHAVSGATSGSVKVLASYIGARQGYTCRDENLAKKGDVNAEFNFSSIAYGPNNTVYVTADNNLFAFNLSGKLIKKEVYSDTGIIYSGICIGKNCVYASYKGTSQGVTKRNFDLSQISSFDTGFDASGITAGDNNDVFLSFANGLYHYQDNGTLIKRMDYSDTSTQYTSISFLYGRIYASYKGTSQGVTIRNLDLNQIYAFETGFNASGIIAGDNNDVFLSSENNLYHYRNDGNLIKQMLRPIELILSPDSHIRYTDIAFVRPVINMDTEVSNWHKVKTEL